jgi:hypothetical protein
MDTEEERGIGGKKRAPSSDEEECDDKKQLKMQQHEKLKELLQEEPRQQHEYGGFASLPTDVLISILCRSRASDHKALRDTCKAFRATIDSDAYKGERATSGWAEVTARLISGEELYDRNYPDGAEDVSLSDGDVDENATEEERDEALRLKKSEKREEEIIDYGYVELGQLDQNYGWHDITYDVNVDGQCCGSIELVLVPRGTGHNYPFHEATDAHSSELQEVGWTLCDSVGRLKVRSIKDAELIAGEAGKGGFIYFKSVDISEAYRPMDCTNIVSQAVRSALAEPKLKGKWTLATTVSYYNVYMTREEKELKRRIDYDLGTQTDEEKERIEERFWECALLDTKTYLRVGFKQIPETVGPEKKPHRLFALPYFLNDPIKSFEEVNQTPLTEPPDLPPKPKGVDNDVLEAVKKAGNRLRSLLDSVRSARLELDKIEQNPPGVFAEMEGDVAEIRSLVDGGKPDHMSDEQWENIVAKCERFEAMLRDQRAAIHQVLQRYRDQVRNDVDVVIPRAIDSLKNEVNALVEKGGSIRKSYAIHCSSRLRLPQYVDFLLDLVPPEERARTVSGLDDIGITPLHCVVIGEPDIHDRDEYLGMVERLLGLGADTNVKSAQGFTPIGQYRSTISEKFDRIRFFGMLSGDHGPAEWRPFHRKMEGLLRPSRGETDADVEAKCAVLDNDVDPNAMDDEEGDDEDDWMDDDEEEEEDDDDLDNMERDGESENIEGKEEE